MEARSRRNIWRRCETDAIQGFKQGDNMAWNKNQIKIYCVEPMVIVIEGKFGVGLDNLIIV